MVTKQAIMSMLKKNKKKTVFIGHRFADEQKARMLAEKLADRDYICVVPVKENGREKNRELFLSCDYFAAIIPNYGGEGVLLEMEVVLNAEQFDFKVPALLHYQSDMAPELLWVQLITRSHSLKERWAAYVYADKTGL